MSTITLINTNPRIPVNVIIKGWNNVETFTVWGPQPFVIPYRPISGLTFNIPVSLLIGDGSNRSWFEVSGQNFTDQKRTFSQKELPNNIHFIRITPTCYSGFTYEAKYIGLDAELKDSGIILVGDLNYPFPPYYVDNTGPI